MTSRQIAPITLDALRHLRMHGVSSLSQLKSTLTELQAKTMNNLVQLGHAMRTEAGYMITAKGKARLQAADAPPKAPVTRAPAESLSNHQTEQRILDTLRRAEAPLTLKEIGSRTGLPLNILRPSLTTLVQGEQVIGSTGKPSRYRLRTAEQPIAAAAAERRRQVQDVHGALVGSDYHGQELRRNPGIGPERFVAFELPSRVGNRLHWPDGRVTPLDHRQGLPA